MAELHRRPGRPPRMVLACYRLVTRLATARHRHQFSDEQAQLFAELWTTERPTGMLLGGLWTCHALFRAGMAAVGTRRDAHRARRGAWWNDVRVTGRFLRRSPWYSLTAIGVIALALTLATTVFAVVDGVLFRPVLYPDADRLFVVEPGFAEVDSRPSGSGGRGINTFSQIDIDNWRAAAPDVPMTAYRANPWAGMGSGVNHDAAGVAQVEPNFFDVIGVAPAIGGFKPSDFTSSESTFPVVILASTWRDRFGGRPDAIGSEVVLNQVTGTGYRVVGIMPDGFVFPADTMFVEFIAPLVRRTGAQNDPTDRGIFTAVARVPAAMSASALRQRLEPGVAATAALFPSRGPKPDGWSESAWRRQGPYDDVQVRPLSDYLGQDSRPLFRAVFLAVAVLVALAAVNLSSLMSSRVVERRRELHLRRALGAPWTAIVRLMAAEAGVLTAAGGAIGVVAAFPMLRIALNLLPDEVVLLKVPVIDWRVGGFAALTVVLLTALTVLAPLWRSRRQAMAAHATTGSSDRARTPGRFLVVASQVAGAFALTVIGALLVGSVLSVYANERPIRTDGVLVVNVMLQGGGNPMDVSPERNEQTRRLLARLRRISGVRSVAATASQVLVGGGEMSWFVRPPEARRINVDTQAVTPDFYQTLEPELVAGRLPTDQELATDAPVIVIGESVARAFWPEEPPVGRTLRDERTQAAFEVVGVVRDVRWTGWDLETASIYGPYALLARAPWINIFIRTDGRTGGLLTEAVRTITETEPSARPRTASTFDDRFRASIQLRRFQSWLFGAFSIVALVVVGVGVLGLLAMSAARRTKEIGIRSALGASRIGVLRWLWLEEQVPVVVGLLTGGALAAWAVAFVKAYLYGVTPFDVRVWLTAAVLILVTAGLGAFVPAWRASRIDPLKALRTE